MPHGMVQPVGQGGADDFFSLTNFSTSSVPIKLIPLVDPTFITVTPSAFTLAPGATQVVTLIAKLEAEGYFAVAIFVDPVGLFIPVRLLSSAAPSAPPQLAPGSTRTEVITPPGGVVISPAPPVPAIAKFTNNGSSPIQAIVVSDVPWIVPDDGLVTIQPGETRDVSYFIDPNQRSALLGGNIGKLSLVFPNVLQTKSSVSITIVFVVRPDVQPGSPPPLAPGEIAMFLAGLAYRPTAIGDLLLATKNSSVGDLKIYFEGRVANLPQLAANTSVSLPSLLPDVFGSAAQSGSVQIRGSDLSKVSVAAVQLNNSSPAGAFGTALPVLRSDQGIRTNEQMVLSGVARQSGTQTDLYIQEMSGNTATINIEFLNAFGVVTSARSADAIGPFGFLELLDAVPVGATAVRITNASLGASRVSGYGLVRNQSSGDSWVVTDPALTATASDSTLLIPLIDVGSGWQTSAFATNRLTQTSSIIFDVRSSARRRSAKPHDEPHRSLPVDPLGLNPFDLGPFQTLAAQVASTPNGQIRVISAPRAVSVAARSTRTVGGSVFGTGLPVVPLSAAIASGDLKRFPGVEDGSVSSRQSTAGGTFRNNLVLVETTDHEVTVRVTLRYAFLASSLLSATVVNTKEYTIGASQYVIINNVIRDVAGEVRDTFGDLHNVQVDVEVSSGAGRIIAFLQSIDNRSGDSIVRTD